MRSHLPWKHRIGAVNKKTELATVTSNERPNRKKTIFYLASLVTVSLVLFGLFLIFLFRERSHRIPRIQASGETAPTLGRGKAACGIAICLHPSDPARTMLVTADRSIGLLTYNLEGGQIEVVRSGRVNSVDVCYNFPYQEEKITLIASSNRSRQGIDFYRVDFRNQKLQFINTVALPFDPVLCSLAFSHRDQCHYLFVSVKGRSDVMHYQLIGETIGNIRLKRLRRLKFEAPVISIAADEDNAALFCSAKAQGIWRLHLDPGVDDTWKT
ncbi:MAG: phytase, partial [Lentisphaerae bacterium]